MDLDGAIAGAGVMGASVITAYVTVKVTLARIGEKLKAMAEEREMLIKHSDEWRTSVDRRLDRLEAN